VSDIIVYNHSEVLLRIQMLETAGRDGINCRIKLDAKGLSLNASMKAGEEQKDWKSLIKLEAPGVSLDSLLRDIE